MIHETVNVLADCLYNSDGLPRHISMDKPPTQRTITSTQYTTKTTHYNCSLSSFPLQHRGSFSMLSWAVFKIDHHVRRPSCFNEKHIRAHTLWDQHVANIFSFNSTFRSFWYERAYSIDILLYYGVNMQLQIWSLIICRFAILQTIKYRWANQRLSLPECMWPVRGRCLCTPKTKASHMIDLCSRRNETQSKHG